MPHVKWTSQAEADLAGIAYYIAFEEKRPSTADRIVDGVDDAAQLYAKHPEMGTAAPELGVGIRAFTYKRWVVIYEPLEDGIVIRAMVDAARDFPHWEVT